jgi:DNA repair protein RecO
MKSTNIALGIILRSTPIGEANLRLSILTADGLITVTATGAQKPTAKLKVATQIFTVAEFEITAGKLTGARVLSSPMPLTKEINRYYLACSIAEVLLQIKNHDAEIFVHTIRTFEELTETTTSAYKIFIDYFSKLLKLLGYDIELEIPSPLGLAAAKKLLLQINAAFTEHLDISIQCIAQYV